MFSIVDWLHETTFNDLIGLVNQKKGKTFMDGLRVKITEFIGVEHKLMKIRDDEFNLAVSRGNFFSLYGTLIVVILGVFVIIFVTITLMKQLGGEEPRIIIDLASTITKGDLSATESDSDLPKAGLVGAMQEMSMKLESIVSEVKSAAENVSTSSEQLNSAAQQLSASTAEQAASTQELSSSMEEMSANISQNSENAGKTEKIATKSAIDAEKGGKAVSETVTAINRIGETIDVIDGIADKIELLALNASIEAARAGEHGKGFAVVANAIKELAIKSKDSATEIIGLVRGSVNIAKQAGSMLDQLVPDIQNTAQLVQEISASSREQKSGAGQINQAIFEMEEANQKNSSSSQELATTANQLSIQATQLESTVDFFKLKQDVYEKNKTRFTQTDTQHHSTITTIAKPKTDQPGLEDENFKRLATGGQE
ncbi:MAG: hypothetical protein GY940_47540 [bacterium]|nr:hypothetical protein [bacterium]